MAQRLLERVAGNPFYVLGLRTDCSRQELEREGQRLLGMLALGLKEAATYASPLGPISRASTRPRTLPR